MNVAPMNAVWISKEIGGIIKIVGQGSFGRQHGNVGGKNSLEVVRHQSKELGGCLRYHLVRVVHVELSILILVNMGRSCRTPHCDSD